MQGFTYQFTAALTNTLLLTQVVLGAALTGLGASDSSRVLITVFGALNTIIAGLIAFLKSRGQPMRARMFRDDLERVVDEIENSATMWIGISHGAHGYDEIDTDNSVTVRSEVARLTRLYDRAVKTNTLNDPDIYGTGGPSDPHSAALRTRADPGALPAPTTTVSPVAAVVSDAPQAPAPVLGPAADPDESPATKAPTPPPPSPPPPPAPAADPPKDAAEAGDDKGKDTSPDGKATDAKPEDQSPAEDAGASKPSADDKKPTEVNGPDEAKS